MSSTATAATAAAKNYPAIARSAYRGVIRALYGPFGKDIPALKQAHLHIRFELEKHLIEQACKIYIVQRISYFVV